jgi:hypothetical protein
MMHARILLAALAVALLAGAVTTGDLLVASFDAAQRGSVLKVGTAFEAAGVRYSFLKDTGTPGAFTVGTPGLAGRAVSVEAGCLPFTAPVGANRKYLGALTMVSTVVGQVELVDLLWINTGTVVTTTTAQTVNSVAFPARDLTGTTDGVGVQLAILVTTATTNAGAIANTTVNYTNSAGVAGRTGTVTSFPATAVIGTVVQVQLAAGDSGVRSVQTMTLGTSYVAGAISLIAYVPAATAPLVLANVPVTLNWSDLGMPRLYTGTCLLMHALGNATTAMTITGTYALNEG